MNNDNSTRSVTPLIAFYVGVFMVFVYAAMGFALIFTGALSELIPRYRGAFGLALLVYAGFRLYMAMRLRRRMKQS